MTEAGWLTATDPQSMLEFLRGTVSDRKLRLFAVACCWDANHPLWEGAASPVAVATATRFADGQAIPEELVEAQAAVYRQIEDHMYGAEPVWDPTYYTCEPNISEGLYGCVWYSANRGAALPDESPDRDQQAALLNAAEGQYQTTLLRDIVGNPFRPVTVAPCWRSETAVALAYGVYAERAFDRLPVLADALEEAGCDHPDVLAHCRDPRQPHARGCWVVDLVLNKS